MKFFFCESCGKRITDSDLETGKGRDKKLKGVYCGECAKGVMTMEMLPVSEEQARKILNKPGETSTVVPRKRSSSQHAIPAVAPREPRESRHLAPPKEAGNRKAVVVGVAAGLALGLAGLMVLLSNADKPERQPSPRAEAEKPETYAPRRPSAAPLAPLNHGQPANTPARPRDPVSETALGSPDGEPAPPAKKDPAAEAFEKVLRFEGLKEDDAEGRAAALEAFLQEHGGSVEAARARVMLEDLKPSAGRSPSPLASKDPAKNVAPAADPAKPKADPANPLAPGHGYAREVFSGLALSGTAAQTSIDAEPVLTWPAGGIAGVNPKEGMSCRFRAYVVPPETGRYTIVADAKGDFTLLLSGIEILTTTYAFGSPRESPPLDLEGGKKYLFEARYSAKAEPFKIGMLWRKSGEAVAMDALPPESAEKDPPTAEFKGGWKVECGKLGSSDVLATRNEVTINANFDTAAPCAGGQQENFWVRWTGLVTAPKTGDYTFVLDADTGARVFVNDLMLYDTTGIAKDHIRSDPLTLEEGKTYQVRVEFVDYDWIAHCRLLWSHPGADNVLVRATLPDAPPTGVLPPLGFQAEYWNHGDEKPRVTRIEARAGADWNTYSPDPAVKPEMFYGRWTGWISPPADGDYTFIVDANSGARLAIDDVVLFDKLLANIDLKEDVTVRLSCGKRYFVKLDAMDISWIAHLSFRWKSAEMPEQFVRAEQPKSFKAGGKEYGKLEYGLLAEYSSARSTVKRFEAALNHNFGATGSPDPSIPDSGWNGKWTGFLKVETSGVYVFKLTANNSGDMKIAKTQVVKATDKGAESKPIPLQKGALYPVEFTLIDKLWISGIDLQWKPPGKAAFEPLPIDAFQPPAEAATLRKKLP